MPIDAYSDAHLGLAHDDSRHLGHNDSHGHAHNDYQRDSRGVSQDASRRLPEVINGADSSHDHRLGRSVSIDQAAQMLTVSRRTVYNRISDGRLRTIRTIGGSQRVLIQSLYELGFRPQAFSTSASAATFAVRRTNRD